VKIGIHLPQWGRLANRADILEVAKLAEESGLDSLWVADHIAYAMESVSTYPYRGQGLPFGPQDGFLEALTQLAVVAGATQRIGLGTSVLVLPMREPLLTSKTLASLDVLSDGRLTVAVGAGWWKEEFALLGAPFDRRGARLDEQLEILKTSWRAGTFDYRGSFYELGSLSLLPFPRQCGGPPILIGGNGPTAWARAGTIGDGWHAVGLHPAALNQGRLAVMRQAEKAGRDPSCLLFSTSSGLGRDADSTLRRLERFRAVGLDQAVLNVGADANDLNLFLEAIVTLASRVLPRLGGSSNPRGEEHSDPGMPDSRT
jgi:probable F420-dependent oxidoreductase